MHAVAAGGISRTENVQSFLVASDHCSLTVASAVCSIHQQQHAVASIYCVRPPVWCTQASVCDCLCWVSVILILPPPPPRPGKASVRRGRGGLVTRNRRGSDGATGRAGAQHRPLALAIRRFSPHAPFIQVWLPR